MEIAVLISGRGSNLAALIKHQEGYKIKQVISNNPMAKGLDIARANGINNTYINWHDRTQAEAMLTEVLLELEVDLIVLAGFMRILSASLVKQFAHKIINIHPSLLPKYPGLGTHQQVLANQDAMHGATVHLVDDQLDQGTALAQITIPVLQQDDADTLANRLLEKEHKLLTAVVGLIAKGDLTWNEQMVLFQGHPMNQPLAIT